MKESSQNENASVVELVLSADKLSLLEDKELVRQLAAYINGLILTNFEKLVHLLYRIDVSEAKLKYLLKENPGEDAGMIIALLIIERQVQKIKFKKEMSDNERDDGGEERL